MANPLKVLGLPACGGLYGAPKLVHHQYVTSALYSKIHTHTFTLDTLVYAHRPTHPHTYVLADTHSHMRVHTHTHIMYTHIHTGHTGTCTQAHTHTHTHTSTRTHPSPAPTCRVSRHASCRMLAQCTITLYCPATCLLDFVRGGAGTAAGCGAGLLLPPP